MRGQTGSGTNNPDVIGAECRFRQRAIAQLPHEGVVDVAIPFRLGCRYEAIEGQRRLKLWAVKRLA